MERKARRNPRADEQEPHRRPRRWGELAQHSKTHRFSRRGKCGGSAGEGGVLTWGDLGPARRWRHCSASLSNGRGEGREVSRSHSTGSHEPGKTLDGLTTWEGPNWADSTTIAERQPAMKPTGGAVAPSPRGRERVLFHRSRLPGTAGCGAACPVVWGAGVKIPRLPD